MILTCPACGQKNRVQPDKLGAGKCGRCQTSLAAPATPIDADPHVFDTLIAGDTPVLVDFWAAWCPRRKALVLKVDTERHPSLAARYGITGIPYFAVFRRGKLVRDQTGLVGAPTLVSMAS